MKRALFIFLVACTSMMQAWAQTYVDDNQVTWGFKVLSEEERTASITSASGFGTEVTIPATMSDESGTYTVTELGENLFYGTGADVVRVALPNGVVSIGKAAFRDCQSLKVVENASSILSLAWDAFSGCSALESIDLASCESIDGYAFHYCYALQNVDNLKKCKCVGEGAFQDCSALRTLALPCCTIIGNGAFGGCNNLESVDDLIRCEAVGNGAFQSCSALLSVDLTSCKSVGDRAFMDCCTLERVEDLLNCETIGDCAFCNCFTLQSIALPTCVSIGGSAFCGCTNLNCVDSLLRCEIVGESAFEDCRALQTIDLSSCKSIGYHAFLDCASLESLGVLSNCETIGDGAFQNCSALQSVTLPICATIAARAFMGCTNLKSVDSLSKYVSVEESTFEDCRALQTIELSSCKSVANQAFKNCSSLVSIGDLLNCETIGDGAFEDCSTLQAIDLPSCRSIGHNAFSGCGQLYKAHFSCLRTLGNRAFYWTQLHEVTFPETFENLGWGNFRGKDILVFNSSVPPTLNENKNEAEGVVFSPNSLIRVPESSLELYRTSDIWGNYKEKIISLSKQVEWDVTCTAQDDRAGLEEVVPTTEMSHVVSLKVSGTINSYDIFMIRTKMYNLHYLDLTDAELVANPFEYYTGCHTDDNIVGEKCFRGLGLISLRFPKNASVIGYQAVYECDQLREVLLPEALTKIGGYAFFYCTKLKEVVCPSNLKQIDANAFEGCFSLQNIVLPSVVSIGSYAFNECYSLEDVCLPNSLLEIGEHNFGSLHEVRLPSSLQRIGESVFGSVKRVYTYTVEPIKISQKTFGNNVYQTAELWMPTQSYTNYFYNTEWGQFRSENYRWFDEPYDYFYLNNDYTLSKDNSADKDKGRFDGEPDVDINPGAGLIVEGGETQPADEIHLKGDGSNWATIIANGNVDAKKFYFDIDVTAGHWYFLCFPFDVKRDNVHCDGSYVFRYYDGQERAENGSGGWKNLQSTEEYLRAGKGYIFQTSANGTLSILVEKEQFGQLAGSNVNCELEANASGNEQDASWNFVGNPFTSYFNMDDMGYDAPVTRWNSETGTYEAVRPGDDDCVFHPFEAFFVQRPADSDNIEFEADKRVTQTQGNAQAEASRQKRRMARLNPNRLMVNLSLGDGLHADKTRVVFNPQKSVTYELDCDAAKFESASAPIQLYSMEASAGRMAINERPVGSVRLGFTVAQAGEYTLSVLRMDQPVLLWDNETHMAYDLCNGDYTFSSQAGVHDDRFMLLVDGNATGVADVARETGVNIMSVEGGIHVTGIDGQTVNVYAFAGILCATRTSDCLLTLPRGVYVVEVGDMRAKVMVK